MTECKGFTEGRGWQNIVRRIGPCTVGELGVGGHINGDCRRTSCVWEWDLSCKYLYGAIDISDAIGFLGRSLGCYAQTAFYGVDDAINGRVLGELYPTCKDDRLNGRILFSFYEVDIEGYICVLVCQAFEDVGFHDLSDDFRFGFNEIRR